MIEHKFFENIELKADGNDFSISGYGAIFNNVDRGNDIILKDAFGDLSSKSVKMLWQHNPNEVIGKWDDITVDDIGLKVSGYFADTQKGNEIKQLVKEKCIDGLSIGYRTLDYSYDEHDRRLLKNIELWEVSLVTFPMNESALVDSKAISEMTIRELENHLRDVGGFSQKVAKQLLAGGFKAINSDYRDDDLNQIAELLKTRTLY